MRIEKLFSLILLVLVSSFAFGQTKGKPMGIVLIQDARKPTAARDTMIKPERENQLVVERVLSRNEMMSASEEPKNAYEISFFRPFQGSLYRYNLTFVTDSIFDSAYYEWQPDSIVNVNLQNSKTKNIQRLKLKQVPTKGGSAGIIMPEK
jgi:hypothetical protein